MLIPPRRLAEWTTVPGSETRYAGVVPLLADRGLFETPAATVVMAYPTSERSDPFQEGVRFDFRWVVQLQFTSFRGANLAEVNGSRTPFAMNVSDDSPLISQFVAGFSDPDWERIFGEQQPQDVIRHFHVSFDDFGRYDVLAADCVARSFALSPGEGPHWEPGVPPAQFAAEKAQEAARLLADAMILEPPPPLVDFRIE
jgi:hypothetical protein